MENMLGINKLAKRSTLNSTLFDMLKKHSMLTNLQIRSKIEDVKGEIYANK